MVHRPSLAEPRPGGLPQKGPDGRVGGPAAASLLQGRLSHVSPQLRVGSAWTRGEGPLEIKSAEWGAGRFQGGTRVRAPVR